MEKEIKFTYLVYFTVGAKTDKFLVKNDVKVPDSLLTTMAKDKINQEIKRQYLLQESSIEGSLNERRFIKRLTKLSYIQIENLNEIKTYYINLRFNEDKVENKKEIIKEEIQE